MMKKYLLIALMSACAENAYADAFNGFYTGLLGGYSCTGGEVWTVMGGVLQPPSNPLKTKGGAYGAVFLGHGKTWGQAYLAGELVFSYDSSHPAVLSGSDGHGGIAHMSYMSQMGFGFAGIMGWFLMPKIMGFIRLEVDCDPSSSFRYISFDPNGQGNQPYSKEMLNLVPGIGLKGALSDQFSWIFGVDYKFCFSSQAMHSFVWKHRPTSIIGKVGISYHF